MVFFNAKESIMKQALCLVAEVPATGSKTVDFFGRQALVYRQRAEVKAALSICPHLGGPLELHDGELVCSWHGARFDAASGACKHGPARPESRAMFLPTRVEDEALTYVWGE
jgi:nitrite reductase/ring-hydroxylating ferredoxin subunit